MKNEFLLFVSSAAFLLFTGCATIKPQPAIPYDETKIDPRVSTIGIISTQTMSPNTFFPGAGCLLCVAAAELTNKTLTQHVKTLPVDDLAEIAEMIHDRIQKRGLKALLINKTLNQKEFPIVKDRRENFSIRDYSRLKNEYAIDKLLLINIPSVNVVRSYSGYFPTSPPKVVIGGEGAIINLNDGSLEWYQPINITRGVIGEWDEPPSFPGLTNAFYEAIEVTKDTLIDPF